MRIVDFGGHLPVAQGNGSGYPLKSVPRDFGLFMWSVGGPGIGRGHLQTLGRPAKPLNANFQTLTA